MKRKREAISKSVPSATKLRGNKVSSVLGIRVAWLLQAPLRFGLLKDSRSSRAELYA